jgi:hypothetical protein
LHLSSAASTSPRTRGSGSSTAAAARAEYASADAVDAILTHLGLPTDPPPLTPARGPPQAELAFDADPDLDLDQTPMYDLTEPEPIPGFDFDQGAGA